MNAWYLVYTKPQQESVALENLQRQGYESYLPRVLNRRRRRGRYVKLVEPMFPRYLFMHLSDQTDNWGPIRSTIGVSNLVRFGMQPARMPGDLIDALRDREDENGLQQIAHREPQPGDRIRIVEGIMAGYEAIFEARSGKQRVSLLLEIANTRARVQVSRDDIEPISGH
jgi:transcriptional antiterminator RfaH